MTNKEFDKEIEVKIRIFGDIDKASEKEPRVWKYILENYNTEDYCVDVYDDEFKISEYDGEDRNGEVRANDLFTVKEYNFNSYDREEIKDLVAECLQSLYGADRELADCLIGDLEKIELSIELLICLFNLSGSGYDQKIVKKGDTYFIAEEEIR